MREFEHPTIVRLCHWVFALAIVVLIGSGLEVFAAFPTFGEKVPQSDLLVPPSALRIGGWLGGALQWHFTFAWLLTFAIVIYLAYQIVSRNGRQVLFVASDVRGVWPMARHYFLFGPKPAVTGTYNPLQKMAYSVVAAPDRRQCRDRLRALQAGAVVLAGGCARRIPADSRLALRGDVRPARVHPRPPGDGGAAWMEKLRGDVDGRQG